MSLNDCFAVSERLMSLDEAVAFMNQRIAPVTTTESLPLGQCLGRILAETVTSPITQPSFRNAAMDGFACRHEDLKPDQPTRLPVFARIAAGYPLKHEVPPGQAVEIFTGAPLPDGLDVVVMVEDTSSDDIDGRRFVTLPTGLAQGNFVRPAGEDFLTGDIVLRDGLRLRPQDIAMAAAVGLRALSVRKRLRVGVFSTGDEVIEPGIPLGEGQIWCSNRFGQLAVVSSWGHEAVDLGHLPDDPDIITAAFDKARFEVDAILTSGGVSLGGEDHVRTAVTRLGRLHLWRLKVKPGKPVALGIIGEGGHEAAFIGLPGYPVSALVTLMVAGRPVLQRLAGALGEPALPQALWVRAGFRFAKKHERRQFLRAHLSRDEATGEPIVSPFKTQESSVLSSMVATQGLIDVAENCKLIEPGDAVPFLPYDSLLR